jgi:hypothetical protein
MTVRHVVVLIVVMIVGLVVRVVMTIVVRIVRTIALRRNVVQLRSISARVVDRLAVACLTRQNVLVRIG